MSATARSALWISWHRHRRTRELCDAFGIELLEFVSPAPRPVRHARAAALTILAVVRRRPAVLFVQCPSIVLGLLAVALKPIFGYRLVADLHNAAIQVSGPAVVARIIELIHRHSTLCLVSNDGLAPIVRATGGRPFVLPDRVPEMPRGPARSGPSRTVVNICSYAADEPYDVVLQAARALDADVVLYMTGNPGAAGKAVLDAPPNVRFTGFLSLAEYERLLDSADILVDLTSREHCLVCGAYEAVALEKPLVTSDTRALRGYFRRGTVYTAHEPAAMARAISRALQHGHRLAREMRELKIELTADWDARGRTLRAALGLPSHRSANPVQAGAAHRATVVRSATLL